LIDIHSHILPGVDDGSKNMEESLQIARRMVESGVEQVVATPHYFPHDYHLTPAEVRDRTAILQREIVAAGLELKVWPGAEIYISRDLGRKASNKQLPTLNNSRYILLEFGFENFPPYGNDVLYDLKVLGLTPIISHPERYLFLRKKDVLLEEWLAEGALIQINSGSLLGFYGKRAQERARFYVKNDLVQLMGSDVHRGDRDRGTLKKGLEALEKQRIGRDENFMENARKVIADEIIIP